MTDEIINVQTQVSDQVDPDVGEQATAVAEALVQHIKSLSVDTAELNVLFDRFQFRGERGHAHIRLNGKLNGQNIESKHEWQIIPQRGSIGGKIIASAVSNTMHGGGDGIRQVTIQNVLSATTATFCGKIDDTLGIETSSVRAGIKSSLQWAWIGFALGFVAVLVGAFKMAMKDKDASFVNTIVPTLLFGGLFACLPAAAAASLRMIFIPGNDIENSPYGANLMNFVGLKSVFGVKVVFAAFAIGAIALMAVIVGSFVNDL